MIREPYAVTTEGLIWLIETRCGQKILRFPWVSPEPGRTLSVWKALEKVRDPHIARVELAPEDSGYVPYVGFSTSIGTGRDVAGTSTFLYDVDAAMRHLSAAGLEAFSVPAGSVLTGRDGDQVLVCSAVAMPGVRGWAPLQDLLSQAASPNLWVNQRGGGRNAHHPF